MAKGDYMLELDFRPRGVCSRNIHVELNEEDNTIHHVEFLGGCDGNLKAISKLIEGMTPEDICSILRGNTCGRKTTSCADQLCLALDELVSMRG